MRGIGGIFYLESGWDATLRFHACRRDVFPDIYPRLVRNNFATPRDETERDEQLVPLPLRQVQPTLRLQHLNWINIAGHRDYLRKF